MHTHTICNCIVQWAEGETIFLNIFDTPEPHFFYLTNNEDKKEPVPFTDTTYELYMIDVKVNNVHIFIPTTATTPEEALSLYPELFI